MSILPPSKLDIDKISFASPKTNNSKSAKFYINYDNKKCLIQSYPMYCIFDVSPVKTKDGRIFKYNLALSFGKEEFYSQNKELSSLLNFCLELDKLIIKLAENNSVELFGKKLSYDELEKMYYPLVRENKDSDYPPRMSLEIPIFNNIISTKLFNQTNKSALDFKTYIHQLKGMKLTCIFQVVNIWFSDSKFGISTKVENIGIELNIQDATSLKANTNNDVCDSDNESEAGMLREGRDDITRKISFSSDSNSSEFSKKSSSTHNSQVNKMLQDYKMPDLNDDSDSD